MKVKSLLILQNVAKTQVRNVTRREIRKKDPCSVRKTHTVGFIDQQDSEEGLLITTEGLKVKGEVDLVPRRLGLEVAVTV